MTDSVNRSSQLDRALTDLLTQAPEIEAAAVVSFDGLPMASALPAAMDEDRVAAMSAALLSLGERASEGLGRGTLNQVYIEGEHGTVFLISADDEAVLVAVAGKGAKVGMMLFEVRRAAAVVAGVLRSPDVPDVAQPEAPVGHAAPAAAPDLVAPASDLVAPASDLVAVASDLVAPAPVAQVPEPLSYANGVEPLPTYAPPAEPPAWS